MADCSRRPQVCTSWDMHQLLAEIQKAQSLLGHVQGLHCSTPCEELTGLMEQVGASEDSGTFSRRHSAGFTPSSFVTCHLEGRAAEPPTF